MDWVTPCRSGCASGAGEAAAAWRQPVSEVSKQTAPPRSPHGPPPVLLLEQATAGAPCATVQQRCCSLLPAALGGPRPGGVHPGTPHW